MSPSLGHILMSKHLGQEAFCLTPEEPHSQREEAGALRVQALWKVEVEVGVEARGFGPNPPVPAPPPCTKGPEWGGGGYPLATAPALAPPG